MESAVLVMLTLKMGLASCMGVMFGWQPMPDGSQKVEYIVQIEPELAATLHEGQSIPITSDIPDNIGPIGRIRIVIGRDELPRQKLATQFKPWPAKQSREGIVETQHRVSPVEASGGGRYSNLAAQAKNAILPPSGDVSVATNPFGRSLQKGAQEAKNLAAGLKEQILPPTTKQLFGTSGQSVQNALNNTTQQLGRDLQRGVQRGVKQVADQTGQRLRQTADNLGRGAQDAINQFGNRTAGEQSILQNNTNPSTATILPPNPAPRQQASNGQIRSKGTRIDEPVQLRRPERWQQDRDTAPSNFAGDNFAGASPSRTNPTSRPGVFNAPWPPTTGRPPAETRVSNPTRSGYDRRGSESPTSPTGWPSEPAGDDSFDLVNRRNDNSLPRYADNRRPDFNSADFNSADYGAAEYRTAEGGMAGPQFPGTSPQQPSQTASPNWPSQTASDDWPSQTDENRPFSQDGKTLFPLLLSWVLLSGSGAGNLYLFWSYLDVRNKYQGVVHGSPSRRDRYED